jgi:hypothetical protein
VTDLYIDQASRDLPLPTLKRMFRDKGAERLFFKRLAPNDNSKNQLYVGGSVEDTRCIPTGEWKTHVGTSTKSGNTQPLTILIAPMDFTWVDANGVESKAPSTQMILYPQYGREYRVSGFLAGAPQRPSTLMDSKKRGREVGRVLLLAVAPGGRIFAYLATSDSAIARAVNDETPLRTMGVLTEITLPGGVSIATRAELLQALGDVHRRGWVSSRMLDAAGGDRPCNGPQCIGQTLLAELGVAADGRAAPDYRGWEIKAYTTRSFQSRASARVTLMTPEPTGGYYVTDGKRAFLQRYGAPSVKEAHKVYFVGQHRVGVRNSARRTTLQLVGYEPATGQFDAAGGLRLIDDAGHIAAEWNYAGLIDHWRRKHSLAAFVPALKRVDKSAEFAYGPRVHLGEGATEANLFNALASGSVIYDPGIRWDTLSETGLKARSQFRVLVPRALAEIYLRASVDVAVA